MRGRSGDVRGEEHRDRGSRFASRRRSPLGEQCPRGCVDSSGDVQATMVATALLGDGLVAYFRMGTMSKRDSARARCCDRACIGEGIAGSFFLRWGVRNGSGSRRRLFVACRPVRNDRRGHGAAKRRAPSPLTQRTSCSSGNSVSKTAARGACAATPTRKYSALTARASANRRATSGSGRDFPRRASWATRRASRLIHVAGIRTVISEAPSVGPTRAPMVRRVVQISPIQRRTSERGPRDRPTVGP